MDPNQIKAIHQTWESVPAELDAATQVVAGIEDSTAKGWGGDAAGVSTLALAGFLLSARNLVDQAAQVTVPAKLTRTAIESAHGAGREN
ncbi:hypothetical protein ACFWU5_04220 [Nocardia sp. NPDC058640]|uniref:hypothetical protein n=1 Tax=Nocardia sp. NPDC058640 TaxID=3346571 RepID=UPI003657C8F4